MLKIYFNKYKTNMCSNIFVYLIIIIKYYIKAISFSVNNI